jgi:hypothetical protein
MTEGQILTNRLVGLACERHLADLSSAGARGLRFDLGAARHAIEFFGFLRHSKGEWAGQTFTVQCEPERRDPDRLVWTLDVRMN